jgi:N-acetylmuramoyl-L-alanine amidase
MKVSWGDSRQPLYCQEIGDSMDTGWQAAMLPIYTIYRRCYYTVIDIKGCYWMRRVLRRLGLVPRILVLCLALVLVMPITALGSGTCGGFTDVSDTDQACAAIRGLSRNVIQGYPGGTFRPQGTLTRAEAAKVLVVNFDLRVNGSVEPSFPDVKDHWAYDYIKGAVNASVLNGFPDGTFRPEENVTRAQFIKMIVAAAKDSGRKFGMGVEPGYVDMTSADWFYTYVAQAWEAHIIGTDKNQLWASSSFSQDRPVTRAEAAMILYNTNTKGGF